MGRALVRRAPPARLQPAVPAARRAARAAAAGALLRARLDGPVRAARSSPALRRARALGRRLRSRSRRSATSGSGGWRSRWAWRSRSAAALALRARASRSPAALLAALCAAASPVAGVLLGLAAADGGGRPALAAARCWCWPAGGGRRAAAGGAVPRRRLRAVPAPLVRGDGRASSPRSWRRCRAAERAAAHRRRASTCSRACCACSCTRRSGSNIERYGVLLAGRCCCARWPREPRRGTAGARPRSACAGALALCRDRHAGCCGGPVRETRGGGGQPGDERRLLRAASSASSTGSRGPGAGRGAADALALGGGAARAAACRWRAAGRSSWTSRYDGVLLASGSTPRAYRAGCDARGGRLRRAAGRAARSLERARGPADPRRACRTCARCSERRTGACSAVLGATPLASGPGRLTDARPRPFALQRARRRDASWCACTSPATGRCGAGDACVGARPRKASRRCSARGARARSSVAARFSLARALGLGGALLPVPARGGLSAERARTGRCSPVR